MDFQNFDHVTRALSSVGTWRRALGLLTALPVLGGLLTLPDAEDVLGRRRRPRRKHRHDKHKHPGSHKHTGCKPKGKGKVCAGKCGPVKNKQTCDKTVDCGPCDCATPCGACFTCDATTRTCKVDPQQVGEACGSPGQLCAADGTCACTDSSCPDCQQCGSDGVCSGGCAAGQICCEGSCVTGVWADQTTFGSAGSGASQFWIPKGIALSQDSLTAWVADTENNRISVWTRPAASSTEWTNQTTFGSNGSGSDQLGGPNSLAVSPDGLTAWVVDTGYDRISVWSRPDGSSTDWSNQTTFGSFGSGSSQFHFPLGVAVSPDGLTAWVGDTYNDRISVWSRADAASTDWANQTSFGSHGSGPSQFSYLIGVAVALDGLTVWVVEAGNHRISVWTRPEASSTAWTNQTTFGSEGSGTSQFSSPNGGTVSPDGLTAWVADSGNARISVWSREDAASTAWSNQATFGSNGSGSGHFNFPNSVAVSSNGLTVGVADTDNNRISVWSQGCSA